jgi:hypothetical protein
MSSSSSHRRRNLADIDVQIAGICDHLLNAARPPLRKKLIGDFGESLLEELHTSDNVQKVLDDVIARTMIAPDYDCNNIIINNATPSRSTLDGNILGTCMMKKL